jgi:hypothetical protein
LSEEAPNHKTQAPNETQATNSNDHYELQSQPIDVSAPLSLFAFVFVCDLVLVF